MPQREKLRGFGMHGLFDDRTRQKILYLAIFMGAIANATYWYTIFAAGGIGTVYGQSKGGVYGYSGLISEAVLFGFVGVMLIAIARHKRLRAEDMGS